MAEGEINTRRIVTPPVFVESTRSCENIADSSSAFCWCEHCITSTSYQCHLEPVEVCLSRIQELE
jgi:hypothetical protein